MVRLNALHDKATLDTLASPIMPERAGEMSARLTSLGREMPLGLAPSPSPAGSDELELLIAYRDGFERLRGGRTGLSSEARLDIAVEAFKTMPGRVLVGGPSLTVLDEGLAVLFTEPAPEEEPIRAILPLVKGGFLTYSDDESVRRWKLSPEGEAEVEISWPISCLPLYARPNGKAVLCLENGRLNERDPGDGRMVKAWPKTPTLVSAFADARGHSLISIDEDGSAQLWDLHSREPLFSFNAPVRIHHGTFQEDGSAGVLLTQDGDLLEFKVAAGGGVKALPALGQPAVDVLCTSCGVVALDESGGLWLVEKEPVSLGGAWAGWATTGLALTDGRCMAGTASGELLLYGDEPTTPRLQRVHQDAVLALYEMEAGVLSVSADGQVSLTGLLDFGSSASRELASFAGDSVVGCHLEPGGQRLWLALEEGRVAWLDPRDGGNQGEHQLPEHRIEELRPGARPGEILILTDRGSLKRLRL